MRLQTITRDTFGRSRRQLQRTNDLFVVEPFSYEVKKKSEINYKALPNLL